MYGPCNGTGSSVTYAPPTLSSSTETVAFGNVTLSSSMDFCTAVFIEYSPLGVVVVLESDECRPFVQRHLVAISNEASLPIWKFLAKNEVKLDRDTRGDGCLLDQETRCLRAGYGDRHPIDRDREHMRLQV